MKQEGKNLPFNQNLLLLGPMGLHALHNLEHGILLVSENPLPEGVSRARNFARQ
jgi:hypothetical protein